MSFHVNLFNPDSQDYTRTQNCPYYKYNVISEKGEVYYMYKLPLDLLLFFLYIKHLNELARILLGFFTIKK